MKFNTKQTKDQSTKTVNRAGGEAFEQTTPLALISLLLTSFVKDQFYRSAGEQLSEMEQMVAGLDNPILAAKAAVYARNEMGMRSITHALAGEVGRHVKGAEWTRSFFERVVRRPDDMTEILAYWLGKYGKPIPNAMKDGLAAAFRGFDEYQLGKYRAGRANVSLVDVANLVHPTPNPAITKLMAGELRQHGTWEDKLSDAGSDPEAKAAVWKELLEENKLGYFALLRNLRNIIEQAPDCVGQACEQLTNAEVIHKTLVMPFRYLTAIEAVEQVGHPATRKVVGALSQAFEISLDNVPRFDGRTLVVLDESGSMGGEPIKIGSAFAAVLYKTNDADLLSFSDTARYRNLNPADSALTIAERLRSDLVGRGTDFHCIFQEANQPYDRLIILSDMQGWIGRRAPTSTFQEWKDTHGCNPYVYSFDLQGYGDMQFPSDQVFCLAGFSERIFDVMEKLETDREALLGEILKVEL